MILLTRHPQGYLTSNKVTRGSRHPKAACHESQASDAFLWFGWVAFVASLVLSILGGTGTANLRGHAKGRRVS